MQRQELTFKKEVVLKVVRGKLDRIEACHLLGCTDRTLRNYLSKVAGSGLDALKDGRHSNYCKLSPKQLLEVLKVKNDGPWRSARKTLEITNTQSIGTRRVQQIWVKHGLNQLNIERLKPITRFVAKNPNDLWQADIMGKIHFPYLGDGYLRVKYNLNLTKKGGENVLEIVNLLS